MFEMDSDRQTDRPDFCVWNGNWQTDNVFMIFASVYDTDEAYLEGGCVRIRI